MSVAIRTDWRGRAVSGTPMAEAYLREWHQAFPGKWESGELNSGCWARDGKGREWWVTDTPEWDAVWFLSQGVHPPKRFGTYNHFYFKNVGGGLSQGSYDPRHTYPRAGRIHLDRDF